MKDERKGSGCTHGNIRGGSHRYRVLCYYTVDIRVRRMASDCRGFPLGKTNPSVSRREINLTAKTDLTTIGVFKADKSLWVQLCKAEGVSSHEKFKQLLELIKEKKEATA